MPVGWPTTYVRLEQIQLKALQNECVSYEVIFIWFRLICSMVPCIICPFIFYRLLRYLLDCYKCCLSMPSMWNMIRTYLKQNKALLCWTDNPHLQVSVFEDAHPECFLAVVKGQHCFHSVYKLLQCFLQQRHVIGQSYILVNLNLKQMHTQSSYVS